MGEGQGGGEVSSGVPPILPFSHQGGRELEVAVPPPVSHREGGKEGQEKLDEQGRSRQSWRQRGSAAWGWWLAVGCMVLASLTGCSTAVGRVVGAQFVSPIYAFAVPLPGDEWQQVADEPSLLTLTHTHLAAGISISVTCEHERNVPLNILTRHLFFGLKDMQILQQESQVLNGVPTLQTVARARLDTREVQVNSYVVRRDGCVYDMVYVASPQDYARGAPSFERMIAGWRFLQQ